MGLGSLRKVADARSNRIFLLALRYLLLEPGQHRGGDRIWSARSWQRGPCPSPPSSSEQAKGKIAGGGWRTAEMLVTQENLTKQLAHEFRGDVARFQRISQVGFAEKSLIQGTRQVC